MKPVVIRCGFCGQKRRRSNPANSRYWLLLHLAADKLRPDGKSYSPDQFHTYYKSRFLGCDEMTMPNGKTLLLPRSTAELDIGDFQEYMEKVEVDLAERGVYLEDMPT